MNIWRNAERKKFMNIDLTPIFQAIISLIAALVAYKLIPWIKSNTNLAQQDAMLLVTRTLVFAAEQLYKTGIIQDRLDYVVKQLGIRGYKVDLDTIEAMVRELNIEQQKPPEAIVE
jgi:hypothetical protein